MSHRSRMFALAVQLALAPMQAQTEAEPIARYRFDGDRPWIGPELYANRLQDWRVRDGRLECIETSVQRPLRTAQVLTASVGTRAGGVVLRVRTGPIDASAKATDDACHGFLLGAGGPGIDHRLTALCHHRPATDGGIVAAVDARGRAVFRDNETNVERGSWGIAGPLAAGELQEIEATARDGDGFGAAPRGPVDLELAATPTAAEVFELTLTVRGVDGKVLSRARLAGVPRARVEGGVALASHLGAGTGHWFDDLEVDGARVERHRDRGFGPILGVQYTLSRGTLKLTAQMPPLGPDDAREARLEVRSGDGWGEVARAALAEPANIFAFRVAGWRDADRDVPFRVVWRARPDAVDSHYDGIVRHEPRDGEVVVAAFTGNKHFTGGLHWNHAGVWFPHLDLVAAVAHHDPDLLFFSGDQLYEGDLTGAQRAPDDKARLDYHDKWFRWVWAFGDLTRTRPTVTIPDDHDVYHGNLWGAGGRSAARGDDGGYTMPAEFVRMVEATQTSHLPDPFDPAPVEQGIGVYFTDLVWGGVGFAILEDRKWKSSPTVAVPDGKCVNGWFQNRDFDPAKHADVPGAELLGARQLAFLEHWAADWSDGVWMKAVLSQTIFANVATLPASAGNDGVVLGLRTFAPGEYAPDDVRVADADSNGWPQSGRNAALRAIRKAFAVHIAGDQHLASLVRYGIDDFDDAGWALCVPSIANAFPRRWFPPARDAAQRDPGAPAYAGRFFDGFGNRMTVHAVANPVRSGHEPAALHDRQPGYGIVRFARRGRTIRFECWPRHADPSADGARQYPGWPLTVRQADNYARAALAWLPEIEVVGSADPVFQVVEERDAEIVYTLRIEGDRFRPPVFRPGMYTVRVGEPDTPRWVALEGLRASAGPVRRVQVRP